MARGGGGGSRGGSRGGGGSRGMRSGSSGRRSSSGMGGRSSFSGGGRAHHGGHHTPPRPPRPPRHHHHHHHHHPHHHHHHGRTYYSGRRGGGCSSVLAAIILITIVTFYIMSQACTATLSTVFSGCGGGYSTTTVQSTKSRDKLDKDLINITTDWYHDEVGIIEHDSSLLRGMEIFYEETGIQPYLYIYDYEGNVTTMSDDTADAIANGLYEELFTDEGHMLICYFVNHNENEDDFPYMIKGRDIQNIIDEEAEDIFWGEFWKNYDNMNYTYEEFLGETFSDAGREIMDKPIPWTTVAIVVAAIGGVIIIIIILVKFWKARTAQKNKEQEDLERMLDKPLETFGESVDDLKEKYDDADDADKTE